MNWAHDDRLLNIILDDNTRFPWESLDRAEHILFADLAPDIQFPYREQDWQSRFQERDGNSDAARRSNYTDPLFYDDPAPLSATEIASELSLFNQQTAVRRRDFINSAIFQHGPETGLTLGESHFAAFIVLRQRAENYLIDTARSHQLQRAIVAQNRRLEIHRHRSSAIHYRIQRASLEYIINAAAEDLIQELRRRLEPLPNRWRRPSRRTLRAFQFEVETFRTVESHDDRALDPIFTTTPVLATDIYRTRAARRINPQCPPFLLWHRLIASPPYTHWEPATESRSP